MTKQPVIVHVSLAACWFAAANVAGPPGLAEEAARPSATARPPSAEVASAARDDDSEERSGRLLPGGSEPQDVAGLQNFLQVTDRISSGGQPLGRAAFERLAQLGVRTAVSVDGARPDVAAAASAGLKYVHIPMSYDGVSSHVGRSLAQLVRSQPGPFYIHCHHGRHRGPAAAAVAAVASGKASAEESCRVLEAAGVSRKYAGLWRDAAAYRVPEQGAELPKLVDVAQVDSVAAAMACIDRHIDQLERLQAADWQARAENPDVVPAHEALLTREAFRELSRSAALQDQRDGAEQQRLLDWMKEAELTARGLEESLRRGDPGSAARRLAELRGQCARCHKSYRD